MNAVFTISDWNAVLWAVLIIVSHFRSVYLKLAADKMSCLNKKFLEFQLFQRFEVFADMLHSLHYWLFGWLNLIGFISVISSSFTFSTINLGFRQFFDCLLMLLQFGIYIQHAAVSSFSIRIFPTNWIGEITSRFLHPHLKIHLNEKALALVSNLWQRLWRYSMRLKRWIGKRLKPSFFHETVREHRLRHIVPPVEKVRFLYLNSPRWQETSKFLKFSNALLIDYMAVL